ncbi:hypothetical protein [Shigella phage ESh22]|nr:hypothetical protein [Shigella phage ESh21]URY12776.1 hypothetical protein [Shigella phage ESh22]
MKKPSLPCVCKNKKGLLYCEYFTKLLSYVLQQS